MSKPFVNVATVLALLAAAGMAGGVAGCVAGKTSIPTIEEMSAAGTLPKGSDLDALRRGRTISVTECVACHRLFLPNEYSPEEWRGIVKRMAIRASLNERQAVELELYLTISGGDRSRTDR